MFQGWYQTIRERIQRIGAWRERRVRGVLTAIFVIWIILDGHVLHISGGIAHSTYDWMVRHRVHASLTDPRIVIVDIDEASLAKMSHEFGRWPWPRDTLATVLADIERQHPAAIVWDILFSDPDRLSPGGDAAFDEAVKSSAHSHFAIVRLPSANDSESHITADVLRGLWVSKTSASNSTAALISPFLDSIAHAQLGLSNAYPDTDGVIRRFRLVEYLPDGSLLQSLPASVLRAIDESRWHDVIERSQANPKANNELIAWRASAGRYPRIPFYRVFESAEGNDTYPAFDFRNKLVIIGASAPTLHDFHPTALSDRQTGVDMLATLLDNTINGRQLREIPPWAQSGIAIALCILIGFRMHLYRLASINQAIVALPVLLLAATYLSLQTEKYYIDLHLAAGWAAGFLAILRVWTGLRFAYWQNMMTLPSSTPLSLLAIHIHEQWTDQTKGFLLEQIEQHAPACRVFFMAPTNQIKTWPDANKLATVIGPSVQVTALLDAALASMTNLQTTVISLPTEVPADWLGYALEAWRAMIGTRPNYHRIE